MPSTQNAVNTHEYRSVPITALAESPTNPRKRFDAKSLEELAASFKTQGVLAPLLVRELDGSKYEVVAGARRLRAARNWRNSRKTSRPRGQADRCRIPQSRRSALRTLQREDIHPLEEAPGFPSHSWNSESLPTPSPPLPHALARSVGLRLRSHSPR